MQPDRLSLTVGHLEIDHANTATVVAFLCDAMRLAGQYDVLVDLGGVEFVDAAAVGGLNAVRAFAVERGGSLALTGVQARPGKVIRLAGLADVLRAT